MQKTSLLSAIFLICGTSIGTGILGFPLATAQSGFLYASIVIVVCWFFTTVVSLYLLEANLWIKQESNLISLSSRLLGKPGKWATWILNLSLLYSLLCLYLLAGSTSVAWFTGSSFSWTLSRAASLLLFLLIMGGILMAGKHILDKVNRVLTLGFLIALGVILAKSLPHVEIQQLITHDVVSIPTMLPALITAFGYSIILPAISSQYGYDPKPLSKAILWGSAGVLIIYLLWEAITLGTLPKALLIEDDAAGVIKGLAQVSNGSLGIWLELFLLGIISTSFIGVSYALYHFLHDGLTLSSSKNGKLVLYAMVYAPPLLILLLYPAGFLQILKWAGIIVALYLGVFPAWMVYRGRYRLGYEGWRVPGGKGAIILSLLFFSTVSLLLILM